MSSNQPEYTMLFECFAQLGYTFPPEVEEEIIAATYLETYKKDEIIHPYKQVCQNVYFITSGLTMTKYWEDDKERILWFMLEGDVFIAVKSFFKQEHSEESIVALEDTQCIVLPAARLADICHRHPSFREVKEAIIIHYYLQAIHKMRLLFKTAEKRCAYMFNNCRKIYDRVNNYHMAWYLGMEQQTFSKVQAKMMRRNRQ